MPSSGINEPKKGCTPGPGPQPAGRRLPPGAPRRGPGVTIPLWRNTYLNHSLMRLLLLECCFGCQRGMFCFWNFIIIIIPIFFLSILPSISYCWKWPLSSYANILNPVLIGCRFDPRRYLRRSAKTPRKLKKTMTIWHAIHS